MRQKKDEAEGEAGVEGRKEGRKEGREERAVIQEWRAGRPLRKRSRKTTSDRFLNVSIHSRTAPLRGF